MLAHRYLEPPPSLEALSAEGSIALFLDFDGTLVNLAPRPEAIEVPGDMAARLGDLSDRLGGRLALISGRAVPDLEGHLGPLRVACAGSHGLARQLADGARLGDADPALFPADAGSALRAFADEHGFVLEEKPHGAALHYRAAPHLQELGTAFAAGLAGLHGLQVKHGKCVIELVGEGADKGAAVHAFMQVAPFAGARPVFVGDDLTDEDGFAAAGALGGVSVIVGQREPTAAQYRLADVAAVHRWIAL